MKKKTTEELENILETTDVGKIGDFLDENAESILNSERPFCDYMHELIKKKNKKQQDIFLEADISERYGYKLLSEEKRTKQRDVILRICYAAGFSLAETQEALKIYGMPQLYAKTPRDAMLMVIFNQRPGGVIEVNQLLKQNGMETLRTSGTLD